MTLQTEMGERIRRRRMALGWNQGQLAEETRCPKGILADSRRGNMPH